jgi:acyl dehydratase
MYFGDTIHVEMEIITTKALKRMGGGKVELQFDVKNQKDDTVMKGVWSVLVMAKPE